MASSEFNDWREALFANAKLNINRSALTTSTKTAEYKLDSAETVDKDLTRGIYHNISNNYKLSGGLTRPIINADVSFIGSPAFKTEDTKTNDKLKSYNSKLSASTVHKSSLRDADSFVWPQWDSETNEINFIFVDAKSIKDIIIDPITKKVIKYVIAETIRYKNEALELVQSSVEIQISSVEIRVEFTGTIPTGTPPVEIRENPFGFIPLVQFSNEKEINELFGRSDLEPIEPYLKAYHDVLLMGLQSQKQNGNPRMQIAVKDVKNFLDTNFGDGTYEGAKKGESVDIVGKDLFITDVDEKTGYMTINSTTNDAKLLLEILFNLIVEASETLEVIFGSNLGTSLASVTVQLPIWVRKIERKQEQFSPPWIELMTKSLLIESFATMETFNADIGIVWQTPDFKTDKEAAEILKLVGEAVEKLKLSGAISNKETFELLKEFSKITGTYDEHSNGLDDTAVEDEGRARDPDALRIKQDLKLLKRGQNG